MKNKNRREFVRKTVLAAGASTFALPYFNIVGSGVTNTDKVRVAAIGCGGMAGGAGVSAAKTEKLVALCDVDDVAAENAYSANPTTPNFKDYRRMLDKMDKQFDAVMISTPDHTHFPIAMACMELGKHVFVQKPMAHNIWQVRTMQKAAEYYNVITNMGNQGHTYDGIRQIKEWYDAGLLGDIIEVNAWTSKLPPTMYLQNNPPLPAQPVPDSLAWDLWLGPTPKRSYNEAYFPYRWRVIWELGCGALGDIGCHSFDAPFWILGSPMPDHVEVIYSEGGSDKMVPRKTHVRYHFPSNNGKPAVTLNWYDGGTVPKEMINEYENKLRPTNGITDESSNIGGNGVVIVGTKRSVYHDKIRPYEPMIMMPKNEWIDFENSGELPPKTIPRIDCHPAEELLKAIKGELPNTGSNFDYASKLSEMVLVGALAVRANKTIKWNADRMEVEGMPDLNDWIKEPVRKGWEISTRRYD